MHKIFSIYAFVEVGALIFAVLTLVLWDRRYRKNHGAKIPDGFTRTEEVTIDPNTNKKLRVYYNPATGEIFYHEEDNDS